MSDQPNTTVLSLSDAAAQTAPPDVYGGNKPILLTDSRSAWVVVQGEVDLFSVPVFSAPAQDGAATGARQYIGTLPAGALLLGLHPAQQENSAGFGLLAVGGPNTMLSNVDVDWLDQQAVDPEMRSQIAAGLDRWILAVASPLAFGFPPVDATALTAGQTLTLEQAQVVHADGDLIWVHQSQGSSHIGGLKDLPALRDDQWIPLLDLREGYDLWLCADASTNLATLSTADALAQRPPSTLPAAFHAQVLASLAVNRMAVQTAREKQLQNRLAFGEDVINQGTASLARTLELGSAKPKASASDPTDSELLRVCQLIGDVMDLVFKPPIQAERDLANRDPLDQIVFASRIQKRRVSLTDQWWNRDNGPLLGYTVDGTPVALLQKSPTRYRLVKVDGTSVAVTSDVAKTLQPDAYMFYTKFGDEPVSTRQMVRFSLKGMRRDLIMIGLMGLAMALLGLLIPIATGWIVHSLIPNGQRMDLLLLGSVLVMAAVSSMLFAIVQQFAILRFQTKSTGALAAAIWDRLLSLPVDFFRQYTAGDLASRAYGINNIRQLLSDATITALVSGLFSLVNFALLFYLSAQLALMALLLALVIVGVSVATSYYQLRFQRRATDLQGEVSGLVLQLLTGISKIRIAGAEDTAFGEWADVYARQQRYAYATGTVSNLLSFFKAAFPLVSSMAIFATIAIWLGGNTFSVSVFVSFNVAFGQFLSAALKQVQAFTGVLNAVPYFERAKPILQTRPEVTTGKADPGVLGGRIELRQVSFRYDADGPMVLNKVSLDAKPGEMVAIVGPSGAGKSTIVRMLLGFEEPVNGGGVFYDRQDLRTLNVQAVRRQIGVVLQNGKVTPGTVLDNIVGTSLFSEEDAWRAATVAGLADDIKQMPMGMYTMIAEGGATFSGGQMQRLMIARAVVGRPRYLIFDEATSALDNETQSIVSENLDSLQVTRLVIAHRLSTIVEADRIFVIQDGRLVQTGTYAQLMAQPGLFQDLAKRQLA